VATATWKAVASLDNLSTLTGSASKIHPDNYPWKERPVLTAFPHVACNGGKIFAIDAKRGLTALLAKIK
jgi:hypothetical protein